MTKFRVPGIDYPGSLFSIERNSCWGKSALFGPYYILQYIIKFWYIIDVGIFQKVFFIVSKYSGVHSWCPLLVNPVTGTGRSVCVLRDISTYGTSEQRTKETN